KKCKRIFDSCVLLFSYQGPCHFDSFDILSYHFQLVKNFFKSFFTSHSAVLFFFFDSHTRLSHLHRFVKNFLKLFSPVKTDFLLTLSVPCSEEHFAVSRPSSPRLSDVFVLCDS
ncbi:hypothetical protein, partial [Blautia argi]|uniref:hypothetical protein n=1 Tax=Blautia argi TaxID=1912897 RepID=UPI0029422673